MRLEVARGWWWSSGGVGRRLNRTRSMGRVKGGGLLKPKVEEADGDETI
jgi:hypothetical protein